MSDDDNQKPTRRAPRKTTPPSADATPDAPVEAVDDDLSASGPEVLTTETRVDEPSVDDLDTPDEVGALVTAAGRNAALFGELIVHYPERDVSIVLDGASASKVMAVHAGVSNRAAMQDPLVPLLSNMANMWASIDMDRALAMSWAPMLPSVAGRKMTIDPALPEALQA